MPLEVFTDLIFSMHACDIKFAVINVRGTCLIRENHEHFIPSKYTRYTVHSRPADIIIPMIVRINERTSIILTSPHTCTHRRGIGQQ